MLGAPALTWENGVLRRCSGTRCLGELEAAPAPPAPQRAQRWALPAPPSTAAPGNHAEKFAELGNFGVL